MVQLQGKACCPLSKLIIVSQLWFPSARKGFVRTSQVSVSLKKQANKQNQQQKLAPKVHIPIWKRREQNLCHWTGRPGSCVCTRFPGRKKEGSGPVIRSQLPAWVGFPDPLVLGVLDQDSDPFWLWQGKKKIKPKTERGKEKESFPKLLISVPVIPSVFSPSIPCCDLEEKTPFR